MMKRLLDLYSYWRAGNWPPQTSMVFAIDDSPFIRRGQHQMMADFLMLELLEQGRI